MISEPSSVRIRKVFVGALHEDFVILRAASLWVSLVFLIGTAQCAPIDSAIEQPTQVVAYHFEKSHPVPVTASQLLNIIVDMKATAVAVNLWSIYCEPCVEELPELIAQTSEFEKKQIALIFVSMDFDEHWDKAAALLHNLGYHGPAYVNCEDDQNFAEGISPRWSGLLPTTLVFDGNGRLLGMSEGKLSSTQFQDLIRTSVFK